MTFTISCPHSSIFKDNKRWLVKGQFFVGKTATFEGFVSAYPSKAKAEAAAKRNDSLNLEAVIEHMHYCRRRRDAVTAYLAARAARRTSATQLNLF